jgi:hypothetical protein
VPKFVRQDAWRPHSQDGCATTKIAGARSRRPAILFGLITIPSSARPSQRNHGKIPFIRINARLIRYNAEAVDRALANGK